VPKLFISIEGSVFTLIYVGITHEILIVKTTNFQKVLTLKGLKMFFFLLCICNCALWLSIQLSYTVIYHVTVFRLLFTLRFSVVMPTWKRSEENLGCSALKIQSWLEQPFEDVTCCYRTYTPWWEKHTTLDCQSWGL